MQGNKVSPGIQYPVIPLGLRFLGSLPSSFYLTAFSYACLLLYVQRFIVLVKERNGATPPWLELKVILYCIVLFF